MENPTLSAFITSIQQLLTKTITILPNQPHLSHPASHFQIYFYTQAATKIANAKVQLRDVFERLANVGDDLPLSNIQVNMLKMIRVKVSLLNREYSYLFEEGILNIYEDICDLQRTCCASEIRLSFCNLLNDVRQCLTALLLHYFLYHEFLHRKQKQKQAIKHSLETNDENRQLLSQIEKEWQNISIHELLQKQVKKQQDKMKEAVQICRICFTNILLKHIEEHVKVCQQNNILQQLKRQFASNLIQSKQQLKKKYQQIHLNYTYTQEQLEFMKIAKVILNHQQKTKEIDRRCSLVEKGKVRKLQDIRKMIQDFIDLYGQEPILTKISQIYKQKAYIEKQISRIKIHNKKPNKNQIPQGKCVADKSNCSIKSKASKKQQLKSLKKQSSIVENSISNNSIPKSESQSSIQFDEFKQKSKKCFSKNVLKKDQLEPLSPLKHYSSLQQIAEDVGIAKKKISLQSFQILKILGEGAFGKVYMVRRKQTRDIYALKIIKIPQSNIQNSLQSIRKQHSIFKKIGGEHLVKAPFSFSEKSCHFFILQYLPGGDLRRLLDEEVYLQEDRARAYLAEIILAIEHLHQFDVIHRDLKPENLVFDKTGHLKLTDFGLSQFQMKEKLQKSHKQQKENIRKTRKRRQAVLSSNKQKMKLIGTPDYIAPEIIFKISSNNFSIDWWSLGVMAYELMIGARPFCAQTIQEVIDNITSFNIQWPEVGYQQGMISPQAKDLIGQLLSKDFMHRLGANGANQIKSHPFFAKICWQTVKSQKPLSMPKMTNVRQYHKMQEDIFLRKEIDNMIEGGQGKRKVDLQQFVRFDLLGRQTIQSCNMMGQKQRKKLKTLKFLQCNFSKDDALQGEA